MRALLVAVCLLLAPAPATANLRPLFTASADSLGGEVEPETDYRGWVGGGLLVLAVLAIGWLGFRRKAAARKPEE